MCYAIVRIEYMDGKEPAAMLPVETVDELLPKIEEVQARPNVRKVTWYIRHMSRERVTTWNEELHQ